jgi:hypothetical protein
MTRGEREYSRWMYAQFPYDRAECEVCATQHAHSVFGTCRERTHEEMRAAAVEMDLSPADIFDAPIRSRKLILAFRKKFAKFYPKRKR